MRIVMPALALLAVTVHAADLTNASSSAGCARALDGMAAFRVSVGPDGRAIGVRPSTQPATDTLDAVAACLLRHPGRLDAWIAMQRRQGRTPGDFEFSVGPPYVTDVEPLPDSH